MKLVTQEPRTGDSLDVGHVEVPTGGQSAKERCHVCGTLEALAGLLVTLAVVNLQVNHRPAIRDESNS